METCPREGVVKEEKFPNTRKPSYQRVCEEFWNLRGDYNWLGGTHRIHNSQWRSSPDACICHQQAGAEQGGMSCMLRVRTRPECPKDNLRELTWDSNPNCRIARERKKERERTFPGKALT